LDLPPISLFGVNIVTFFVDLAVIFTLYLIVSLTLNLEAGYTGIPNFGKVLFVAGGAAVAGSVSGRLATLVLGINTFGNYNGNIAKIINQVNADLSANIILSFLLLITGVVVAAGIGAGLGYLASFPAIRLREDYLGMLLLASAQFFQIFLAGYEPLIGGTQGIQVPDVFGWALSFGTGWRDIAVLAVLALFALAVYVLVERLVRSPLGRTLRAVRDNEVAARALGKNDIAIRRKVIIVASAISGVAGALLTFYVSSVGAETWTRIEWTFWIWVILIVGGAANNLGVALGALSFTFFFKILALVKFHFQPFIPFDVNWFEYIAFGTLLIMMLVLRPEGILPEKSSTTLSWRRISSIMQSPPGPRWRTPAEEHSSNTDSPTGHDDGTQG
jgi:branched-chain amino acid transport system permease protein